MAAEVVPIVAEDVVEKEFERWIEAMDLDIDPDGMDDEDKKSFVDAKRILIRAMKGGSLVVNEGGELVFTPTASEPNTAITFHEPKGSSIMAMDSKKRGHDVAKLYATMADATRQPQVRFSNMANRDLKVSQAIILLFLG